MKHNNIRIFQNEYIPIRAVLILWVATTIFCLIALSRNLDLPHPEAVLNFDELAYGSWALELAESGNYSSRRSFPDGLYEATAELPVVHTILSPYLQAVAIDFLGFNRVALRLHSILAFAASALILLFLAIRMRLAGFQLAAVFATFFLSPWIFFAGITGRAEALGIALVFASCLVAWELRNRAFFALFVPGFIAGLAVYNHITLFALACMPYLLAKKLNNSPRGRPAILNLLNGAFFYGAGAAVAFAGMWVWLLLPNYDVWKEAMSSLSGFFAGPALGEVPQALKALFSKFGTAYLNWYLAVVLFALLLRWSPEFFIGAVVLLIWMVYLLLKMGMVVNYCIQFAAAMPLLLLLCNGPRFDWCQKKGFVWILLLASALQAPWNAWRVTAPNPWVLETMAKETKVREALHSVDGSHAIIGNLQTGFPVLEAGHRFFNLGDNWALADRARFDRLCREQASFEISEGGELISIKLHEAAKE